MVLVFNEKVLAEARWELVISGMGPNPYNAISAVRDFSLLEEDINSV